VRNEYRHFLNRTSLVATNGGLLYSNVRPLQPLEVVKVREIIRELEDEGWFLSRQREAIDSFIILRRRVASLFLERWATTSPK
jgi:hypothetical protein